MVGFLLEHFSKKKGRGHQEQRVSTFAWEQRRLLGEEKKQTIVFCGWEGRPALLSGDPLVCCFVGEQNVK